MEKIVDRDAKEEVNKKKVVLVVEDDQFLAKLYQLLLEKQGVEVWTAANGDSALSFLEKEPPNAVVLDLMLPGASGFEVLTALRAKPQWKDTPVLIVSNLGQAEDIKRAEQLAVKDYIVKSNIKIIDVVAKVITRLK